MRLHPGHGRERSVDHITGNIVLNKAMRQTPAQDGADTLAHPSGGLRLRSPYRCQNAKHVTAVDAIDGHVADDREGVTFERLQPTGGVLAISPARQIRLMHAHARLAKRRGVSSTLFRERITSFSYCSAVCVGVQACLGERNGRVAAQSDIASAAIDRNSLYPSL